MDRRIRHISSIEVHNLTPFPTRDTVASALTKPAEHSQFTPHGHLSDDLDVANAMHRKRSRRISANSQRSVLSAEGSRNESAAVLTTSAERGRKTSGPRVSFPKTSDHRQSSSGSAPTIRPHRPRTSSAASSILSDASGPSQLPPLGGSPSILTSSLIPIFSDNSQAHLENVIESRLVETFIAITVLDLPTFNDSVLSTSPPLSSSPACRVPSNGESNTRRKVGKPSTTSPSDKTTPKVRRESVAIPRNSSRPPLSHAKSLSTSAGQSSSQSTSPDTLVQRSTSQQAELLPHFFSPLHRPSTHPRFSINATSNREFTEGIDYNGSRLKIELWGKVGGVQTHKASTKGKEKAEEGKDKSMEWKLLQQRNVDLKDLVPVPDSSTTNGPHLPLNVFVFVLSPPGKALYLPPSRSPSPTRSPSPSAGYASDPEPDVRSAKESLSSPSNLEVSDQGEHAATVFRRRHRTGGGTTPLTSGDEPLSKTASWQDLFKLVTLQSCIKDNESSLRKILDGLDKAAHSDDAFVARREISEYNERLDRLTKTYTKVVEDSDQLRSEIHSRMTDLHQRKQRLKLAKEHHQQDVEAEFDQQDEIIRSQTQHFSLRARFAPIRTTLIDTVSSIYPIELLSPPDLLFTILDVPLPIPLTSSDPAPPLTLPSHKDVNEDSVATALGYAAQVLQLLSAYLGKNLVYPVTCIGSRSLIRDNISAMVGPRMFPLYSKGVDTYRFEYGVFLLNKNIELLMADRDLRALDMRHTLPNLKNLLLTLSDGEGVPLPQPLVKVLNSPMSFASDMELAEELASRTESPVDPNSSSTTPKASATAALDGNTPPASRSSTPTAAGATDVSKKQRSFIAFSPLTDFLRARYPSSSRISTKSTADPEEPQSEEPSATPVASTAESGSDDDDHRTISGTQSPCEGQKVEVPPVVVNGVEKLSEEIHLHTHPTPPFPQTPVVR